MIGVATSNFFIPVKAVIIRMHSVMLFMTKIVSQRASLIEKKGFFKNRFEGDISTF